MVTQGQESSVWGGVHSTLGVSVGRCASPSAAGGTAAPPSSSAPTSAPNRPAPSRNEDDRDGSEAFPGPYVGVGDADCLAANQQPAVFPKGTAHLFCCHPQS